MAPFHHIQSISFKYVQNQALARHRSCPILECGQSQLERIDFISPRPRDLDRGGRCLDGYTSAIHPHYRRARERRRTVFVRAASLRREPDEDRSTVECGYFALIRSTSKISVAPGGMSAPAPLAP